MMLGTAGCTITATLQQNTDTTSNITGTTSGSAWWSRDGQIKPDFKATALGSVSRPSGIPIDRQPALFSAAQANHAQLVDRNSKALRTLLRETSQPFVC